MNNDVLFSEQQRFRQWWFWLIITIAVVAAIGSIIASMTQNQQENNSGSLVGLLIAILFIGIFLIFFFILRLELQIKQDGIYVRFFPLQFSTRFYPWTNIVRVFVKKYRPIVDFGGWGIRYGLFGKGKVLNVSGNIGLQLIFTDNKKLLIGTQQAERLDKILQQMHLPAYQPPETE